MSQQTTIDTTASPVVQQATGLAAFELQVSANELVITLEPKQ